jgi:hypothetical protein
MTQRQGQIMHCSNHQSTVLHSQSPQPSHGVQRMARIQTRQRFIHHQHLRIGNQRARQHGTRQFATG